MAIEFKISGLDKLAKTGENLRRASEVTKELVFQAAGDFAVDAHHYITEGYLSGPRPEKLGVVTGRLRSSIKFRIDQNDNDISIRFGSSVPYAAIHEFGGDAGVGHKVHLRQRAYLTPGIMDAMPKFRKSIEEILFKVASGVVPNG